MHRLTSPTLAVVALCMSAFVPSSVSARDDGRYADSALRAWFDQLASGRGLCCSFADGVSIRDVDWDTQDGRYRARLHGEWIFVPDGAVVDRAKPLRPGRGVALYGCGRSDTDSLLLAGCGRLESVPPRTDRGCKTLIVFRGFVMRDSSGGVRLAREGRLQIMLSAEELKAVDNFRIEHRMPSRAAAVRELLRHGIAAWVETRVKQLV